MQVFAEVTVAKSHFQWSALGVLGQNLARAILAAWFLVTMAPSAVAQSPASRVSTDAFGEVYVTALAAPAEQTRVFVYRSGQAPNASPVNIYLNGQYHASLLRGGFTEFCAAPGAVNIKAALDDASRLHTSKLDAGQRLELKAGQTNFLKVDESTLPAIGLLSGTAAQTKAELESTRRQIHTISRAKAALTCGQPAAAAAVAVVVVPPPPAPKPPVPREYALETDALFEFGKAEIRASGYNAIESLVQRLLQDFSSVERIRVVGYTDPIGSAAFNKKLSQDRADVVARQIVSRNIPIERGIEAEGRGPIELVKTGCGNTPTPENKICHAPNRRVMVVITGARR
jgi:OOP family OmpA-OmpF porin